MFDPTLQVYRYVETENFMQENTSIVLHRSEKDAEEYIKKLHHQHMKAIQKLKEAEKNVFDPVNLKLRSDKVLDEAVSSQKLL